MSFTRIERTSELKRFLPDEERLFYTSLIESAANAVYGCFTFRDHVDEKQADTAFRSFIENLSRRCKENIGWIRSTEKRLSGCSDYRVHLHYHFVLFSHAQLSPAWIEKFWSDRCGNAKCAFYDNTQDGIGYILKQSHNDHLDWAFSDNLYLFLPGHQARNRHERRALERQALRAAQRPATASLNAAVPALQIKTSHPVEAPRCRC